MAELLQWTWTIYLEQEITRIQNKFDKAHTSEKFSEIAGRSTNSLCFGQLEAFVLVSDIQFVSALVFRIGF